jgi:epoxyqueuosine reductase
MPDWCLRFVIVVADDQREQAALWTELRALAATHGLTRVGVAPATVMERARRALRERAAVGLHDTMQFTYRNPERSTDPRRTVDDAQSVIVAAWPYLMDEPPPPVDDHGRVVPAARVARYAWTDHYAHLRTVLQAMAHHLHDCGHRAVVVADDNALVDREAAWLGGLGWFGKNANLLVPGAGSWFVLGNVITTAPLAVSTPVADGCGPCRRCLDGCPTGAIVAPGVVDAGRCLAWILQRPGVIPHDLRVPLSDRLYGCDDCQEVCPPTVRLGERHRAASPPSAAALQAWVPVLDLLDATDDAIMSQYGRWYIHARDPLWLRRNAVVVLGNIGDGGDAQVVATLRRLLADPTHVVLRAHAVWAAARLGRRDLIDEVFGVGKAQRDVDAAIAHELALLHAVPVQGTSP